MADAAKTPYRRGLVLSAAGMLVLSPDGLLLRLIEDAGLWDIVFFRSLFTGIALLVVLLIRHRRRVFAACLGAGRRGLVAALLMTATNLSFLGAITHTTVANTLVMLATLPLFGAILGRLLLGERVRRRTWVAIAAALAGVAVMFAGSLGGGTWVGDLLALLTAFVMGLNLVNLRRATGGEIVPALCLSGFLAATVAALMSGGMPTVSGHDLGLLILLGFVVVPLSFTLFFTGVRFVPAAEVALLALIETVLGPLWVWLGVGEVPTPLAFVGGIVVIAAIAGNSLAALRRHPRPTLVGGAK